MKRRTAFELALDYRPPKRGRQQSLYEAIRAAIVAGRLPPGTRLPSTRALAESYGVARTTAVAVFEQLASEGYLVSRQGAGSRVAQELPEAFLQRPAAEPAPPRSAVANASLSRRGRAWAESCFPLAFRGVRPLSPHVPDPELFPWDAWARLLARTTRRLGPGAHAGGDARGHQPLREAIAAYLTSARGVRCEAERVLVVSGTQQALDLAARLLLDPGDGVLLEDPAYAGAQRVFEAHGAKLRSVAVDGEGATLPKPRVSARLAYLTPAHQAPTGAALSRPRRDAWLAWAHATRAWIFEDDYDSEYRYLGPPLPALQGLDAHGAVLHAGSFGKTLFPALRLGYLVLPEPLVGAFAHARSLTDRYPPLESQAALAEFLGSGRYGSHLRRMRQVYAERREALGASVARHLSGLLTLGADSAGLETVAWLPEGWDDVAVAERARAEGLAVEPVSGRFAIARHRRAGLLLGFASTDVKGIERAVVRLGAVLRGPSRR